MNACSCRYRRARWGQHWFISLHRTFVDSHVTWRFAATCCWLGRGCRTDGRPPAARLALLRGSQARIHCIRNHQQGRMCVARMCFKSPAGFIFWVRRYSILQSCSGMYGIYLAKLLRYACCPVCEQRVVAEVIRRTTPALFGAHGGGMLLPR